MSAPERRSHQIVAAGQHLVEIAQHLGALRLGIARQEAHRAAILAHEHVEQQRQDAGALGEVDPLQVLGVVRAVGGWRQPLRGVTGYQVLGDGAGFGQYAAVELDDG